MERKLLKVHGSGNVFYLYETDNEEEFNWVKLTKWLCDQANEGGADGLLLVLPSQKADAKMRIINADGSEASMCGNGLRCVARYVCEKYYIESAVIETMKANLSVKKEQPIFLTIPTYGVEISPVSFELESLPMNYNNRRYIKHQIVAEFSSTIPYTALSVPNPHLIGIVGKHYIENQTHQCELAKFLNGPNYICPDGINVSYVFPVNNTSIFVRTYERGVGFTNACGTAMTASALVSRLNHIVSDNEVTVYNPGGFVKCQVQIQNDQYKLALIGNATVTASYTLSVSSNEDYTLSNKVDTDEQTTYQALITYVKEQLQDVLN